MLDGQLAIARAKAKRTNRVGACLWEVWDDFGQPHDGRTYATALTAWEGGAVGDKHAGDWDPPMGAVVFFGASPTRTDKNRAAGDVVISLGGGLAWCTDALGAGRPGVMTLRARAAQIQRPYLGWGGSFFGQEINVGAGPLRVSSRTLGLAKVSGGSGEMVNQNDVAAIANAVEDRIRHAQWSDGTGAFPTVEEQTARVTGYGRRVEHVEAMVQGYGQRTENVEKMVHGYGQRTEDIERVALDTQARIVALEKTIAALAAKLGVTA